MTNNTDEFLYIMNTCYRESYVQTNYNVLSYPPGFTIRVRAAENWISNSIINRDVTGMQGVFVVATGGFGSYTFHPARKIEVVDMTRRGSNVVLDLELQPDIVNTSKTSHENIIGLDEYPRGQAPEDTSDVFWTIGSSQRIEFSGENWTDSTEEWETLVKKLGTTEEFDSKLFYRIINVKSVDGTTVNPEAIHGDSDIGYTIQSDTTYQIELSILFAAHEHEELQIQPDEYSLHFRTDDRLQILPKELNLGIRRGERRIHLSTKENIDRITSPLIIQASDSTIGGPQLNIPIYVSDNYIWRVAPTVLIFIGIALASGIADPFVQRSELSTFLVLLGVVLTTAAFELLNRHI